MAAQISYWWRGPVREDSSPTSAVLVETVDNKQNNESIIISFVPSVSERFHFILFNNHNDFGLK